MKYSTLIFDAFDTVVHIDEETARSLWSQSPYNENSDRICAKIQEA